MAVANLIKLAVCPHGALPYLADSYMQKWCALEKGPWSYARVKKLFSFFLSIYSRCGALQGGVIQALAVGRSATAVKL